MIPAVLAFLVCIICAYWGNLNWKHLQSFYVYREYSQIRFAMIASFALCGLCAIATPFYEELSSELVIFIVSYLSYAYFTVIYRRPNKVLRNRTLRLAYFSIHFAAGTMAVIFRAPDWIYPTFYALMIFSQQQKVYVYITNNLFAEMGAMRRKLASYEAKRGQTLVALPTLRLKEKNTSQAS